MKKLLFTLAAIIISFLIVEIFLGYLLWIRKSDVLSTTYYTAYKIYSRLYPLQNNLSFFPNSPYIPDKYLGYSDLPGLYTFKLRDGTTDKNYSFTATINGNGNRITSYAPELFKGKKEIWIFGDSFTYGWGNNDETTFPFFLQQFLPNFRIVNYADVGYGNIHEYLQIKREFEKNNTLPEIMVIVYGDYFNVRNVAAPSRLKEFRYNTSFWEMDPSAFLHPRALVKSGKIEVEYVPLFQRFDKTSNGKDPSEEYQYDVTKTILSEIYSIGKRNGIKLVLAFIKGDDSDEVVSYSRKIGYCISDIRPKDERLEWDDFAPFDRHPGPLAQNNFAIKLYKTISKVISNTEK